MGWIWWIPSAYPFWESIHKCKTNKSMAHWLYYIGFIVYKEPAGYIHERAWYKKMTSDIDCGCSTTNCPYMYVGSFLDAFSYHSFKQESDRHTIWFDLESRLIPHTHRLIGCILTAWRGVISWLNWRSCCCYLLRSSRPFIMRRHAQCTYILWICICRRTFKMQVVSRNNNHIVYR